jgi:hypothetical protein
MDKRTELTARPRSTTAPKAPTASRSPTPQFLLREEMRPVRMQLELLKPEMVQNEQGIESTIVIFGSARIVPPDVAQRLLADAQSANDETALRSRSARAMSRYYEEARRFAALVTEKSRSSRRRSTSSPAAAPASWKPATAARSRSAARASA